MSGLLIALFVIVTVVAAALAADVASKDEGNRPAGIGIIGYVAYIVTGLVLALLMSQSKVVCIVIAVGLGALAVLNKEGKKRAISWNLLLILNMGCLVLAIVHGWDRNGHVPVWGQFNYLLIPLVAIVISTLNGRRLEADPKVKARRAVAQKAREAQVEAEAKAEAETGQEPIVQAS